jgi:hypothetical protein
MKEVHIFEDVAANLVVYKQQLAKRVAWKCICLYNSLFVLVLSKIHFLDSGCGAFHRNNSFSALRHIIWVFV